MVVSTHPLVVSTLAYCPRIHFLRQGQVVLTHSMVVSTLDPASRRSFCHLGQGVDTLSGGVDTLRLKSQCIDGDETLVEETVETDSERGV
ncbi:hypothetical protein Taro_016069 [Colocasia esculenta]|uniref:Uncharacterized protein n=1 Tax=Colocasia esculenta TaxID=4460 RepID=A0A843UV55_COLES|nr:hypothetical protein [Colocasia esculenta]